MRSARNFISFLGSISDYVRTGRDLTVEEARAQIRTRLENREQMFLTMVEHCIFRHPRSPYLPLLKAADCELGDIQKTVAAEGVEQTLRRLRGSGVYFAFEEFKGRAPVERSGVGFEVHPEDFANPTASFHVSTQSSGSTGPAVRGWMSLNDRKARLANALVDFDAHGLCGIPATRFDEAELSQIVATITTIAGPRMERRFAPRGRRNWVEALRYELAYRSMAGAVRLAGTRLPKIEWVDPHDALPVAKWAEAAIHTHGRCLIWAGVSKAVRTGIAAYENGIDLHGASIMGNDEPPTPAKVRAITRTGAKWIPVYGSTETGFVGTGCVNPVDGTDVHLVADRVALIQHARRVPGSDLEVDAFNFTVLWTVSPLVLLNVELDDFGILERRNCGCPLEELGYNDHLREIHSFRKLTGEGVTLVGSDMIRILEDVLPSRFGGTPLDYQLMEEEDESSLTKLSLLIHPKVEIADEALVVETVLNELKSGDGPSSMAGTIWAQAGTLRVRRLEPVTTPGGGKLMPLHVSRRSESRHLARRTERLEKHDGAK